MIKTELINILDLGENIWSIVLTGGPGGGKTTGLARLSSLLVDRGYKVLVSSESATHLMLSGVSPEVLGGPNFQKEILFHTLEQEQRLFSVAIQYRDAGHRVVILFDRGTMDGKAYVDGTGFDDMTRSLGFTQQDLCDYRYHAVMHMTTAASGAEKFYTLDNNKARTETPDKARFLDQRTVNAWTIHPHPRVIDNSTDFDGKIRRLFAEVCGVIGDPIPLEKERKFLIEFSDPAVIEVHWTSSDIIQDYLVGPDPDVERRLRSRGNGDQLSYYFTMKRHISAGVRDELDKLASAREYEILLTFRKPDTLTVKKRRICFFWNSQFFEVDHFSEPEAGLALMEAEQTDQSAGLQLPPFIKVIREVTDDKRYSNSYIARSKT